MTRNEASVDLAATELLILRLVRGELPLDAARWAGVSIERSEGRWQITVEKPLIVKPTAQDCAFGLLSHAGDGPKLRDWASFMLGAANVISLEKLEAEPRGEAVLEALWDASFQGVLKPRHFAVVKSLAGDAR